MHNFIIKPDGLFPSTYSQMGRVLIPSKDCKNRKIARKFTEKGATLKIDSFGGRTISTPYISTFKRFDRPSPLISENCQNCRILSVPSVTDKTIYPCSLGKYSVTEYSNTSNAIGQLGNSLFPRITTSNNQLYQQYRVTEKNNIIQDSPDPPCDCPYTIETGVYTFEEGPTLSVFTDECDIICVNLLAKEFTILELTKIGSCKYRVEGVGVEGTLEIIGDNMLELNSTLPPFVFVGVSDPIVFIEDTTSDNYAGTFNLGKLEGDCAGVVVITNVDRTNGVLTFKENGVPVNLGNEYYETVLGVNPYFTYNSSDAVYGFYFSPTTITDIIKLTCNCARSKEIG